MTKYPHLWQGEWIDDATLEKRIAVLGESLKQLSAIMLGAEDVLRACDSFSRSLLEKNSAWLNLKSFLTGESLGLADPAAEETLQEIAAFLERRSLETKVHRELSSGIMKLAPFSMERMDFRTNIFESWMPLGFLVHIAPSNALNVPFLSVIEGLLTGNINFLKTGGADSVFAQKCLEELIAHDPAHTLAPFIMAAKISSKKTDLLKSVLIHADGVSVWGSEESVAAIQALTPPQARLIPWGPKISFAYFERSRLSDAGAIEKLAREVCFLDQQACSSPQVVYLETESALQLRDFAKNLAAALEKISPGMPAQTPSLQESAEITQVVEITRIERSLGASQLQTVWEAGDLSWRVLIDDKAALRASPLFRTIWVKALPRGKIISTLLPLRHYLQTVGLAASGSSFVDLSQKLFRAGALRITPLGEMVSGYSGEPHDGVYALQRYARRVSIANPTLPEGISSLEEILPLDLGAEERELKRLKGLPLIGKHEVAAAQEHLETRDIEVFFRSGGSSGEPKLSVFTYDDYDTQMKLAAQGLFAAGLDPAKDRSINLFFAGGLYGGFLSFFTILEELKAVQFPMAAESDLKSVAECIVKQKINVLLGMPSYLWKLFSEHAPLLESYGGVEKVFYGGEHFSPSQRDALKKRFGVKLVKSAAYGSNDTGPMGFQCRESDGGIHHVHTRLQTIEILQRESDLPVAAGEAGRLLLSSKVRRGQEIQRYEIGDLGRWIEGDCPCGRTSPRFELLGRYGDVFKLGTMFLNYRKFEQILAEDPNFSGTFQILIDAEEKLKLHFANASKIDPERIRESCLKHYPDLYAIIVQDQLAEFSVKQIELPELVYAATSGKLRNIVDRRNS